MKSNRAHLDEPSSRVSEAPSSTAANTPEANNHDSPSDDPKTYSRGTGKRNRVHFACTECYRRKQKCNRETPCQHCIARKIPERCKTFQPGEETNDVAARLNRVERILEDYLPKLAHQINHLATSLPASLSSQEPRPSEHLASSSRPHPSRNELHSRTASASRSAWSGSNLARSPDHIHGRSNDQDDDDIDELEPDGRYSPKTGFYNGGSMDMRISSILDDLPGSSSKSTPLNLPIRTLEGPSDLDIVMPEYGCPTAPTPDLLGAFSTRAHCNILIDHFFNDINWMRQPLPQRSLRKSFQDFWNSGPKISASNINIFALLCNVCAIAMLSVQHPLFVESPRDRLRAARRYHYAGRRALLMSSIMGREDLEQIVAWLASCRFLLLDRRIGEAYTLGSSAVRAAFSIGLHRDGTKLGLPPAETESRRRVWASVYFLDRALALNTGRPAVIDDRVCDTQVPSGVADEDIFPAPKNPPKLPEGVEPPTAYSYTVHRQRIAELEGRILATFQNLEHPIHVSDVLALDKSLRELQDSLPFYFQARLTKDGIECDKSLDATYGFLCVHRFLLQTEINSVRIALHRPYLLRSGGPNGAKFLPCREASLNAALHDLEMRRDFVQGIREGKSDDEPVLLYRVQIGTFKYFHSLLVVGVVLLMDPNAPDAPKLKAHLQHYVDTYQRRPANQRDEMRDREANVIGIFLSRIEQVEKTATATKGNAHTASASRSTKRSRSTDAGRRNDADDRDGKSSKRNRESAAEPTDEKTDAHLLLGLGGQSSADDAPSTAEVKRGSSGAKWRPTLAPSDTANATNRSSPSSASASNRKASTGHGTGNGNGPGSASASRQGSGEWSHNPRGLANAVNPSPSGSNSNSPSTSSLPAGFASANAAGDSHTPASSTPARAPAANGGGEDAQQFFDAWYQAEWAAATMPSYDAAYNGANSAGGPAAGISLGLESLGNFGGVFGSQTGGTNSVMMPIGQGLGGGFNGLGGASIGAYAPAIPGASTVSGRAQGGVGSSGMTPGAVVGGWNAPTSQVSSSYPAAPSNALADLLAGSQPMNDAAVWQSQGGQHNSNAQPLSGPKRGDGMLVPNPTISTSMGGSSNSMLGGAGSGVGAPQADGNFDPAFWQTLIDKIIT